MFDLLRLWSGLLHRFLRSRQSLLFESCSASAVGGFQTPALSSETDSVGQDLLDVPTPLLVFVEDGAHRGNARNRGPLAPLGVSALLAVHLTRAEAGRQKAGDPGDPRSDLPDGGGESHLACSSHPWRTRQAGVRCFRTQRLPLDAP